MVISEGSSGQGSPKAVILAATGTERRHRDGDDATADGPFNGVLIGVPRLVGRWGVRQISARRQVPDQMLHATSGPDDSLNGIIQPPRRFAPTGSRPDRTG